MPTARRPASGTSTRKHLGLMSDAAALTDPAWIKQGRTRFVQVCAYCHGTHGTRGDAGKTAAFDARRGWGFPGHPRGDRQRACDRCQHHAGVDAIDPRRRDLGLVAYIKSLSPEAAPAAPLPGPENAEGLPPRNTR